MDLFICSFLIDTQWRLMPLGVSSPMLVMWLLTGHKSRRNCFLLLLAIIFRMHWYQQCLQKIPFIHLFFDIGQAFIVSLCHCIPLTDLAWQDQIWYLDCPLGLCPWISGVSHFCVCSVFEFCRPGEAQSCIRCMGDCFISSLSTSNMHCIFVSSVGDVPFVIPFCGGQMHCLRSEVFCITPYLNYGI